MPQVLKRTPRAGTVDVKKTGRPSSPKHAELYAKTMNITLTGDSREKIQSVAAAMHKAIADHAAVRGGKTTRRVCVVHNSSEPIKVFDGTILPDSI